MGNYLPCNYDTMPREELIRQVLMFQQRVAELEREREGLFERLKNLSENYSNRGEQVAKLEQELQQSRERETRLLAAAQAAYRDGVAAASVYGTALGERAASDGDGTV